MVVFFSTVFFTTITTSKAFRLIRLETLKSDWNKENIRYKASFVYQEKHFYEYPNISFKNDCIGNNIRINRESQQIVGWPKIILNGLFGQLKRNSYRYNNLYWITAKKKKKKQFFSRGQFWQNRDLWKPYFNIKSWK